jgi:TrmH family RNA methyltransferase
MFAIAETPKPKGLEMLKTIKKDIVVLEDVSISGNIGNIIRTSLGLDMGGMILLNMDPLDLYDRRLIRASRGYMFSLPIMTASTTDFLAYCKANNETLLVTAMEAENRGRDRLHPRTLADHLRQRKGRLFARDRGSRHHAGAHPHQRQGRVAQRLCRGGDHVVQSGEVQ